MCNVCAAFLALPSEFPYRNNRVTRAWRSQLRSCTEYVASLNFVRVCCWFLTEFTLSADVIESCKLFTLFLFLFFNSPPWSQGLPYFRFCKYLEEFELVFFFFFFFLYLHSELVLNVFSHVRTQSQFETWLTDFIECCVACVTTSIPSCLFSAWHAGGAWHTPWNASRQVC